MESEPRFLKLNPAFDLVRVYREYAIVDGEPLSLPGRPKEPFVIPQGEDFIELDPFSEDRHLLDFVGVGDTRGTRRQGIHLSDPQLLDWCSRYGLPEQTLVITGDTGGAEGGKVVSGMSLSWLRSLQRSVATVFSLVGIVRRRTVEELRRLVDPKTRQVAGLPSVRGDLVHAYIDRRTPATASADDKRLVIAEAALQQVLNKNMRGSVKLLWDSDGGGFALRFAPESLAAVLWLRLARFAAGEEMVPAKGKQKQYSELERCHICKTWDFHLSEYRKGENKGKHYHINCEDSRRVKEHRERRKSKKRGAGCRNCRKADE